MKMLLNSDSLKVINMPNAKKKKKNSETEINLVITWK